MAYPPNDYPEFANNILDRLEWKLRNDPRMPPQLRRNIQRSHPIPENRAYPILYFEDGEDDPSSWASSGRDLHVIRLRLTILVKEADPVRGAKTSKDYTFAAVKTLKGTLDDRRLLDAQGNALAHDVKTRQRWSQAAKNAHNEYVWVGVVHVEIHSDFRG